MIEAIVRIRPSNNWISDIAERYSADIKILDCVPIKEDTGRELVEIKTRKDIESEIITEIRNHPAVCNVDLSTMQNGKLLGEVVTNQCSACNALRDSDCFLIFAHSCDTGQIEWKLQTRQRKAFFDLLNGLRDLNFDAELVSVTRIQESYELTTRQEELLQFALKKGYFDCPKKVNIRTIAKTFGISISTTSEILRRGLKKAVSGYFNVNQVML